MSKNLTAQQLADELGVTRQLIYYHAKKLPVDEKIFDDDNTLVFSPSQQSEISSYMTDTIKESKNETVKVNTLTIDEGEKARIIETKVVSNEKVKAETNENNLTNDKEDTLTDSLSNELPDASSNVKESVELEVSKAKDENRSESVKMYIQHVLRDQIGALYPVKHEETQQNLLAELEEKNQQISTLHKLLDQQQQLALISEQKHQKLLDVLGVEDVKQLEKIVKQAAKENEEIVPETSKSEETVAAQAQPKKTWFQRIFG